MDTATTGSEMNIGIVYSAHNDARVWKNEGEGKIRIEVGSVTLFLTPDDALELAGALKQEASRANERRTSRENHPRPSRAVGKT